MPTDPAALMTARKLLYILNRQAGESRHPTETEKIARIERAFAEHTATLTAALEAAAKRYDALMVDLHGEQTAGAHWKERAEADERRVLDWRKAFMECTPSGSEYTTPEACRDHVQEAKRSLQKLAMDSIREKKAAERRVAELESHHRQLQGDLDEISDETGVDGPWMYDGCWRAQIPGTNVAVKRFPKDQRGLCEVWIAEHNAKQVEHSPNGWPHRALEAERRVAEAVAAEREKLRLAESALDTRVQDIRSLEEDIEKLRRVAMRAISASVTVTNDVARDKLMEAIADLPMRLRARATPAGQREGGERG